MYLNAYKKEWGGGRRKGQEGEELKIQERTKLIERKKEEGKRGWRTAPEDTGKNRLQI